MREWLISEYRRAGPRKIVIVSIAIVIMVALAFGNNIDDSDAHTLPRAPSVPPAATAVPAPQLAAGAADPLQQAIASLI